jgi:maltose alpha-D-glucosyltransferase / alpha-amylase
VKKAGSASDPLWYKDAILYEVHVRTFADSNADGIGDFPGLTGKLDYLRDLGVTCLWLLPFFPSPLLDDGYDIADYTDVHPTYGTLDDFRTFLKAAHQCGMQVVIEMVMNHTSSMHPWFQRARNAPAGSIERNYYVWNTSDTLFKDARIIFTDTEKSNWAWDPVAKEYYWHRFFSHQPDLNYDNPVVLQEMLNAVRFWLDMGVDGLRFDAIPYLVERDGTSCENLPETHSIIRKVRAAIDAEYENRFVLAEANQWPTDVRPYFGDGDECHMAFHFPLMPRMYVAIRQEDRTPITEIMRQTPAIPDTCQWGLFLRNHDELTLEMVTQDERDYMYLAYSADPRMRINLGIRRRLAPLLDNNRGRIELLNSLLYSFPGTPILYYGDEIGMGDNVNLGDRNGVRTPMQWNSGPNAGFSTAPKEKLYAPVIEGSVYGFRAVNVAEQLENPSSNLQWTRNMIALRKLFTVFGRGTLRFLDPANHKVLAYLREWEGETVLCVANLSRFAQPVELALEEFDGRIPMEMFGYTPFPKITVQPYSLTLAPYSFLWFQLQAVTDRVSSTEMAPDLEQQEPALVAAAIEADGRPGTHGNGWQLPAMRNRSTASLLLHFTPATAEELHSIATMAEELAQDNPSLRITLAFPMAPSLNVGPEILESGRRESHSRSAGNLNGMVQTVASTVALVPYEQTANALPSRWPYPARTYAELGRLAAEHEADVAVRLGQNAGSFNPEAVPALIDAILSEEFDLAVPLYHVGRYDALLNTAVLHPLTRALYGANIRYPLGADMAFSARFCRHIAAAAGSLDAITLDEHLLWPVTAAASHDFKMVEVRGCVRQSIQPSTGDLNQLLTHILSEMFADAERLASQWQKGYPVMPTKTLTAAKLAALPEPSVDPSEDAAGMYESFRLAAEHLQDIWSRAMSPGTQLRLKRLVEMPAGQIAMPDSLWVNIVYDFLVSYHMRSVNPAHLFGALVPLYLGWAASYVLKMRGLTDEQGEAEAESLAATFEKEKPYLMSRWRWPDRFAP